MDDEVTATETTHTYVIWGYYDGQQVTNSSGETTTTGWPDAPPALLKAQTMARTFKGLAAKWAEIEADETAKLQDSLSD